MNESDPQPDVRPASARYDAGDAKAFIDYPEVGDNLEHVPINVRPELHYYIHRMGFLPHTLKLYLHVPWIAEYLFKINNAIMRDERNSLSEHLKYKLALLASRDNGCRYCTAHNVYTLKRRWSHSEDELEGVLRLDVAEDDREAAALKFVHQASVNPHGVTDALRESLAEHFSPQEVMEIVQVVGFWKLYNTMHAAMAAPLETPVLDYREWVEAPPD